MRLPHLRAQQAGPVGMSGKVLEVQSLSGCDLLQQGVSGRSLPSSQAAVYSTLDRLSTVIVLRAHALL